MTGWAARFRDALVGTRSRLIVSLAVVGGLVVGGGAVMAIPGSPTRLLLLEAAAAVGPNPFVRLAAALPPIDALFGEERSESADDPASLDGGRPGLYGGSRQQGVCDPDALVEFLTTNEAEGRAWAGVLGIELEDIADHVATLTPAQLRVDVRVTNHGFDDGRAVPRQSILQAGTAVLIDQEGVPRVRCACGNPLLEPEDLGEDHELQGTPWEGFDPTRVYVIEPGDLDGGIVLHDARTDSLFFRPFGTTGGDDQPVVPDVLGDTEADAVVTLSDAGLEVVVEARDDTAPAGEVIETRPPANRPVPPGEHVTLIVSTGIPPGPPAELPDLAGQDLDAARAALEALGLTVGEDTVAEPSDTAPAGTVARTDPPAGTPVTPGTEITIHVSTGPAGATAPVPDTIGSSRTEAEQALRAAGFTVTVVYRGDDRTVDTVLATRPGPGAAASIGSSVALTLSRGPSTTTTPPPRPTVPDVVGRSEGQAQSTLAGAGFAVAVEKRHDRRVAEGAVIAQTPVGGAESTAGATVTIVVSLGVPTPPPPDPIVPDVVGHTRARAEAVLVAADFAPAVEEASSERVPAGTVISQAPGGGNRRPLGTRVVITVSTGVPPVPVPALGGLCEPAASERVRAARLAADVVGVHSETVQPRCVVSQSPVGGALVPRGSSVTISISLGPPPVTVPNVVGRSVQEAEAVLGRAGFAMELLSRQHSSTVREGAVISQRPAGGTSAERGAEVGVVLSIGPAPVVVPNVVGRSVDDAQTTLRSAGLAMVDRRCFAESEVSSQNPRAGASVPQGTPVEVFDHCIG